MSVDHIRYDLLTQEALRSVLRRVLGDMARSGLPGDHHFYICFDTNAPGVRMSQRLRAQYPEEITIVLQHQFWDLAVTEQGFEVGLSFAGVPERLVVPFDAIKRFFDPSVQFGLQFETIAAEDEATAKADAAAPAPVGVDKASAAPPQPTSPSASASTAPSEPAAPPEKPRKSDEAGEKDEPRPPTGGEVVRLDRFRKK